MAGVLMDEALSGQVRPMTEYVALRALILNPKSHFRVQSLKLYLYKSKSVNTKLPKRFFDVRINIMNKMNKPIDTSKGPGVYVPPPLFYVITFIAAVLIQGKIPLSDVQFQLRITKIGGITLLIIALFFLFRSLRQFFLSKNTIILIKPASSLQTTGIYKISRNPMYVGLAVVYLGLTCLIGNWWNIILFPLLLLIVQEYIIKREEKYLELEFGQDYEEYTRKVRRWL